MPETLDHAEIGPKDALLVVDIQNDFCSGGALGVPDGEMVVPLVNRLMPRFHLVVFTQDWHPAGHSSFASSHPGTKPFETIEMDYGAQILWPDHCMQGTDGAAFHKDLDTRPAAMIIRKGMRPAVDSYSAFFENDKKTITGLTAYLKSHGVTRVFIAGLALDFCVRYSAEDAVHEGFEVVVIDDACRAIDTDGSRADTLKSFEALGVKMIRTEDLR
ncbi:MAG TPA: bifunctional nicotinamidase/pyrazinamidase [Alphaproteobacteria bacterium]|nr:bifunctional nicotinamidase/pyrazinamidase [Alphaproteobacteria bacterium]